VLCCCPGKIHVPQGRRATAFLIVSGQRFANDVAHARNRAATLLSLRAPNLETPTINTGPEISIWFGENEASFEAADTAHDRGNEGEAATNLPHDAINNGKPETAAGPDR
jgi:hypothetical protein